LSKARWAQQAWRLGSSAVVPPISFNLLELLPHSLL
jgi:hypothetical protein